MQTFADVHGWSGIKMANYIVRPQANHAVVPSRDVIETLDINSAFELPANNATARTAFAEIALEHVLRHAGVQQGPVCFVTFTPACCAFPVGDELPGSREQQAACRRSSAAAAFNVVKLQQMIRQAMGDIPFIGMIEVALFRQWGPEGRDYRDWVCWHVHVLTWGATRFDVSRRLEPLRRRHRSIRQDLSPVHVRAVPKDDVGRQFLYALKAPQKLYRVEYFSKPWTDPESGEVRQPGWHTQKEWLQTGHRIRLLDIMGHRKLDELLFGNREGTALAHAICDEALAPFRAWERRQAWAIRR